MRSRRLKLPCAIGVDPLEPRRLCAAGDLDPTFGDHGIAHAHVSTPDQTFAEDCIIDARGRLLLVGPRKGDEGPDSAVVARFNRDGTLDSSFGQSGLAQAPADLVNTIFGDDLCIATSSKGKIVFAGVHENGFDASAIHIVQLNSDGTLDRSFANDGVAKITMPGNLQVYPRLQIKVQADGKILIAFDTDGRGYLLRINTDGKLDSTFANKGIARFSFREGPIRDFSALSIDRHGRCMLAGAVTIKNPDPTTYQDDFHQPFVCRLRKNGRFDSTFAAGGRALLPIPNLGRNGYTLGDDYSGIAATITPDGRTIFAAEQIGLKAAKGIVKLISLTSSGELDFSFGNQGVLTTAIKISRLQGLSRDSRGNLFIEGTVVKHPFDVDDDLVIARTSSTGALDTTFGKNGIARVRDFSASEFALGVDGAIHFPTPRSVFLFTTGLSAKRLTPQGVLDSAYGTSGEAIAADHLTSESSIYAEATQLLPNGQLAVLTTSNVHGGEHFFRQPSVLRFDQQGNQTQTTTLAANNYLGFSGDTDLAAFVDGSFVLGHFGFSTAAPYFSFSAARFSADASEIGENWSFPGLIDESYLQYSYLHALTALPDATVLVLFDAGPPQDTSEAPAATLQIAHFTADGQFLSSTTIADSQPSVREKNVTAQIDLATNGDIVVIDAIDTYHIADQLPSSTITRLHSDLSLDQTFGQHGKVTLPGTLASHSAVQSNGKIVFAVKNDSGTHLERLNTDGSRDLTFGANGIAIVSNNSDDELASLVTQDDGRIIAGFNGADDATLTRFLPGGELDTTFGNAGHVTLAFAQTTYLVALHITPAGKLLAVTDTSSDENGSDAAVVVAQYDL